MNPGRTIYFATWLAGFILVFTIRGGAQDAPSGLVNPPAPPSTNAPAPPPVRTLSPVIWSEHADIVQRLNVDGAQARRMVDACLLKLTSASDAGTAWSRLGITPDDVVGIKITTMGGPALSTHRAIVQAICDGLGAAGVPPSQIVVWDKDGADMLDAGYTPTEATDSHVGIASVFPGTGYDPNVIYKNGILGTLIWGDYDFIHQNAEDFTQQAGARDLDGNYNSSSGALNWLQASSIRSSNQSYYARLVTRICTKIINVPVLTDNAYVGINGCLASLALASVDNNRRFQGDPTYGDPAVCEILGRDFMRRKVVVNILDAMIAQYAGGPRFDPQFTRSIGAIYVSRDPVAIDSIVLRRLEKWRANDRNGRIDPIGKTAGHVHDAASYNLGTDDPARIQLIRIP
jgi:hypothetical protein